MTIEELKARKTELGLTNENIAKASAIPLSTIQKIMGGVTRSPRKSTLEAIERVLYEEELRRKTPLSRKAIEETSSGITYRLPPEGRTFRAAEASAVYARAAAPEADSSVWEKDGRYTLTDYYALPDERRVELIDGVFYDMSAPAYIHQKVLGELYILFRECIEAHGGDCEVVLSPCDVRLDRDNRTMVQPDLFVLCRPTGMDARYIDGAPDLTIEILSPSTRSKDMLLKLYKYQNAGVREYWVVDPENRIVLVYDLAGGIFYPDRFDFDAKIPVHISEGKCSIDFSKVNRAISRKQG